ncbi:glycosyltransferase family 2 protein [Hyphomonas sp. NPDC076900]|uniref:glycosyltransferase family 2 protein n=1 Tax=unclassified Hyphomonas TaxID=2630699 RepID=UPI003CFC381F
MSELTSAPLKPGHPVTGFMNRHLAMLSARRILSQTALFDGDWYLGYYPDLDASQVSDPLAHYLNHGASEQRDPSPLFDTAFYLRQYPLLDTLAVNPLCHYLIYGEAAGAWPNPYFDPARISQLLPDRRPNQSVLEAYVSLGAARISPSQNFDAGAYLDANSLVEKAGLNPLWHKLFTDRPTRRLSIGLSGDLELQASHDLETIAVRNRQTICHVTDQDPYLVIAPRDGAVFAPGHYRLQFSFSGPPSALDRAKLYFDHSAGFTEAASCRPCFQFGRDGLAWADVSLEQPVKRLRFDPIDSAGGGSLVLGFGPISFSQLSRLDYYSAVAATIAPAPMDRARLLGSVCLKVLSAGPSGAAAALRDRYRQHQSGPPAPKNPNVAYLEWIERFDTITRADREAMRAMADNFEQKPVISIVMPVYNTPEALLCECIDSVLDQTYPHWELCIADDRSPAPHIRTVLDQYAARDPRIKVVYRVENGHISKASNSALEIASGEWVALLDHDDKLAPHALFCVAEAINRMPHASVIYSDEDKIDLQGVRKEPYFKSGWNERLFFEQNMVSHLGVYRKSLVDKVGGFRAGLEGSQDHDLALRIIEQIKPEEIVHIPHVLYHWRILPGSTAMDAGEKSYAAKAGLRATQDALERRQIKGRMEPHPQLAYYRLKLDTPEPPPLVSIIIPTRDGLDILEPCIRSLISKTTYTNYEIIIVDNQSSKPETLEYFEKLRQDPRIRIFLYDDVFNYSAINNFAVEKSRGELVCLLNNDTEVIEGDWLREMVAEISQPGVGAVGAKLLYTDGTVQHAGVVLGAGGGTAGDGVAAHAMLSIDDNDPGYFALAFLTREVSAATAACLLMTKSVFNQVGGLNERDLRVAFNDVDLCLKIRAAGQRIIWTPYAKLYHHESKSRGLEDTPEKLLRFRGEVEYMRANWGDRLRTDPYYNSNLEVDTGTYFLATTPRIRKPWVLDGEDSKDYKKLAR